MNEGIQKAKKRLRDLADKERARNLERYFKTGKGEYGEGDIFLGIRVPEIRKLANELRCLPPACAYPLLESRYHEERLLSLLMLIDIFKRGDEKDKKEIFRHYLKNTQYINNWDLVDVSAPNIVGAYLLDRDKKPIYRLAESNNLWERRIAIISTSYLIRHHLFDDTFNIAQMLLHDKEDLIHKAVGWMLREVGKRNREVEEDFLKDHYTLMPRVMLRYSIERFPEKKRQMYLKGKV